MAHNRLKEWREIRGLTQSELAEKSGLKQNTISRLESDNPETHRQITEQNAIPLAKALNIQPGELLPVITDGSVPLPDSFSSTEKATLAAVVGKFIELHTQYDPPAAEQLGMACVKFYQMALSDLPNYSFLDLSRLKDNLHLDQNSLE